MSAPASLRRSSSVSRLRRARRCRRRRSRRSPRPCGRGRRRGRAPRRCRARTRGRRRAADLAEVDADRHRQLDSASGERRRDDADDRPLRVVRIGDRLDLDGAASSPRRTVTSPVARLVIADRAGAGRPGRSGAPSTRRRCPGLATCRRPGPSGRRPRSPCPATELDLVAERPSATAAATCCEAPSPDLRRCAASRSPGAEDRRGRHERRALVQPGKSFSRMLACLTSTAT